MEGEDGGGGKTHEAQKSISPGLIVGVSLARR